jgi:hypothetical protein
VSVAGSAVADADAVSIAYVHPHDVSYAWHKSMIDLLGYDLANHQRVMRAAYIAVRCSTGGLVEARNEAVRMFLEDGRADWLWWVDTDMGFRPDVIDRLVDVADPVERPVVGALCFAWKEMSEDGYGGYACAPCPTLYRWAKTPDGRQGFLAWMDYPDDQVVQVAGTGSACILIHRSVFETIGDKYGAGRWYDRMTNPSTGQLFSEDLSFCAKAGACGVPIHVDTRVKTTHHKQLWVGEDIYRAARS